MTTRKYFEKEKSGQLKPVGLNPNPDNLNPDHRVHFDLLRSLAGQSILSVSQMSKELILEICKFAALLQATEVASSHPLDGRIVITAFFEASTRTRLSFESAVVRLDGRILSIHDAKQTGIAKGESLGDIGEMFNAYGDLVIMRHTETDSLEQIREKLRIPLINAGNGSGEHPTQALADWFALLKWRPSLGHTKVDPKNAIHLGIVGTPGSMRAVKSFLMMSLAFKQAIKKITIISEMADPFGEQLSQMMADSGLPFEIKMGMENVLEELDVVYMNSIAYLGDSYRTMDSRFKIDKESNLKNDTVVMHPLARKDELSTSLDHTHHNLYFSQAYGAVFVRQALLISIMDRFETLPAKMLIK